MTFRNLTAVVAITAGLGTAAAAAAPGDRRATRLPATRPVCPAPAAPATKPSEALLSRFGVLREDREAEDALPADVLAFLRGRGVTGVDPSAARLLRTGANGGRAWVLPLADVRRAGPPFFDCFATGARPFPAPARPARPGATPMPPAVPAPAVPPPAPVPRVPAVSVPVEPPPAGRVPRVPPVPSTALVRPPRPARPAPRPTPRPARPVPAPRPVLATPALVFPGGRTLVAPLDPFGAPQEGLLVVARAGAPTGGGGALEDLLKGLAAVSVEPCAEGRADLTRISGVVPDGVDRVFLTADDGSAVEARPDRNGFVFTVPVRAGGPQQRYVVWTPGDGTPRVQPVVLVRAPKRIACAAAARTGSTIDVGPVGRPVTAIPFAGRTRAARRG